MTDIVESDTRAFLWMLAKAKDLRDDKAIAALKALGKPPYNAKEMMTQRRYLNQLGGVFVKPQSNLALLRSVLAMPEFAWPDFISFLRGDAFSLNALCAEQQRYDARTRHLKLEAPIFFMLGRSDRVIFPQLGADYLAALEAPKKEAIWFEQSAHMAPFEEPDKFNAAVRQVARQVARQVGLIAP